jgi:hypothetical protein
MCNSLSIVTATTISLVGGTVNTTARTARGVIVIATIAIGGITVGMTVADTGMVIVATVSIAVGTGATATATTTLRPSLNSSFDNNKKPSPLGDGFLPGCACGGDVECTAVFKHCRPAKTDRLQANAQLTGGRRQLTTLSQAGAPSGRRVRHCLLEQKLTIKSRAGSSWRGKVLVISDIIWERIASPVVPEASEAGSLSSGDVVNALTSLDTSTKPGAFGARFLYLCQNRFLERTGLNLTAMPRSSISSEHMRPTRRQISGSSSCV